MKNRLVGSVCLIAMLAVAPSAASADAVLMWSENAGRAAIAACLSPFGNGPAEARMYAMMHVAIHDALNAIDRRSRPYAFDGDISATASPDAAMAAAARTVLISVIGQLQESPACIAAGIAVAEADYSAAIAPIPAGDARTAGIQLGEAAAAAILALRASDGANTLVLLDFAYPSGTRPGEYQFVPGTNFAFAPGLGEVTPFVLKSGSQFRAGPPYNLKSKKYAADFNEIKALGGDDIVTPSARTPEQTEIGLFWIESSPLSWNRLTRSIAEEKGLDSWENARLFGLLNLALADGYIGSWETKYHYNFWRPVTAIHEGDTDGNPATEGDPTWTPLQPTYPMPDHDSGHAVEGGAAAEALKQFFGTDHVHFSACSLSLPAGSTCNDATPVLRSYDSFSEAADENAVSRILIGIHFRRAVEEGVQHGRKIAKRAANLFLKPVQQ
jgi:hypothetical protein